MMELLQRHAQRDNLVNSAILELVEFVRQVRVLIHEFVRQGRVYAPGACIGR